MKMYAATVLIVILLEQNLRQLMIVLQFCLYLSVLYLKNLLGLNEDTNKPDIKKKKPVMQARRRLYIYQCLSSLYKLIQHHR